MPALALKSCQLKGSSLALSSNVRAVALEVAASTAYQTKTQRVIIGRGTPAQGEGMVHRGRLFAVTQCLTDIKFRT